MRFAEYRQAIHVSLNFVLIWPSMKFGRMKSSVEGKIFVHTLPFCS